MGLSDIDNETIMLIAKDMRMRQETDMTCFSILNRELKQGLENRIQMLVVFRRKIMNEMMTTYFPSVLLMMITYATTFFKPFFFEAALSVNLTTMLVMTTIFISKMEGLPPTSATKMIDYWLILCQLVPFAQVVLLTIKENLREEEQEENLALERDQIQQPEATKDNSKVNMEVDSTPREAWTISEIRLSKADSLTVLNMIGTVFVRFKIYYRNNFQRRK